MVGTDRGYFDAVLGIGGEDAGGWTFPRFIARAPVPAGGPAAADRPVQPLPGHPSRHRPQRPAGGPGVSHTHALLVAQPDGWAVVDLGSSNGTYLNDPQSAPVPSDTPVPIAAGDRVFVGAWTCLSIRTA